MPLSAVNSPLSMGWASPTQTMIKSMPRREYWWFDFRLPFGNFQCTKCQHFSCLTRHTKTLFMLAPLSQNTFLAAPATPKHYFCTRATRQNTFLPTPVTPNCQLVTSGNTWSPPGNNQQPLHRPSLGGLIIIFDWSDSRYNSLSLPFYSHRRLTTQIAKSTSPRNVK